MFPRRRRVRQPTHCNIPGSPWWRDGSMFVSVRNAAITSSVGLEFPNPGSFCKPGFSGLGKVKPEFRVRIRVWKSRICIHCKLEGGSAVAVDGWIVWANFFGSHVHRKLLQNCKYCRSDTLILIDLMMRQIVRLLWSYTERMNWNIGFGWHGCRKNEIMNCWILTFLSIG